MDSLKKVNLNTLNLIVGTNFVLIMILSVIFSIWRISSNNLWLKEVKGHIDADMKTVINNQEKVKIDLIKYNEKILNVKTEIRNELVNHIARVIKNHTTMIKNQETIIGFLKEINGK